MVTGELKDILLGTQDGSRAANISHIAQVVNEQNDYKAGSTWVCKLWFLSIENLLQEGQIGLFSC